MSVSSRAFISYSHDSREHSARILNFAWALRSDGIDVELDQFHNEDIVDWPRWCSEQISRDHSDFVVCVCSAEYKRRIQGSVPPERGKGVYWEGSLIDDEIYDTKGNRRIIAVVLDDEQDAVIPHFLRGWTHCRVSHFNLMDPGYEQLIRILTRQASVVKNELGEIPKLPARQPVSPLKSPNASGSSHLPNQSARPGGGYSDLLKHSDDVSATPKRHSGRSLGAAMPILLIICGITAAVLLAYRSEISYPPSTVPSDGKHSDPSDVGKRPLPPRMPDANESREPATDLTPSESMKDESSSDSAKESLLGEEGSAAAEAGAPTPDVKGNEETGSKRSLTDELNGELFRVSMIQSAADRIRMTEQVLKKTNARALRTDDPEEIVAYYSIFSLMAFDHLSLREFSQARTAWEKQMNGFERVSEKDPVWKSPKNPIAIASLVAINRVQSVLAACAAERGQPKDAARLDDQLRIAVESLSKVKAPDEFERAQCGGALILVAEAFLQTKNVREAKHTLEKAKEMIPEGGVTNHSSFPMKAFVCEYNMVSSYIAATESRQQDALIHAREAEKCINYLDDDADVPKEDNCGVLGFVYLHSVRCSPQDPTAEDRLDAAIRLLRKGDECPSCKYNLSCALAKKAECDSENSVALQEESAELLSGALQEMMESKKYSFVEVDIDAIRNDPFLREVITTDKGQAILIGYKWVEVPIPIQMLVQSNGLFLGQAWHTGIPGTVAASAAP